MLNAPRTIALAVLAAASVISGSAFAADMIYQERTTIVREPRPVAIRTTYVRREALECRDLLVDYRAPLYEPYSEIVRVCYKPKY